MPWLKQLWKLINRSWTIFFGALALFSIIVFSIFYFGFKTANNEDYKYKTFRVARDPDLSPINLMGKEKNLSAFINELFFKVAHDANLKVTMSNISYTRLLDSLSKNSVDAILSTMAPTASTRPRFLFSMPLFEMGPVLVAEVSANFQSLEDLRGKNVGIRRGDSLLIDNLSQGILFVQYDSYLEALEDLETKKIEAVLMQATTAYTYTKVFYPGKLKVITRPLREEGLRIVATKSVSNHYFIETFNKGLNAAYEDGSYDALLIKWGLINPRTIDFLNKPKKP